MEVSGTLHLYSGRRRELFFVFDDDVAQQLYAAGTFDIAVKESREVYISVGLDRFINLRTMSFSKKQTEIKVSLCAHNSKDDLRALTELYDWFVPRGNKRPQPFPILGELNEVDRNGEPVWELHLQEPVNSVVPPGLARRQRTPSKTLRTWRERRLIIERDTSEATRLTEALALELAQTDFSSPQFNCLWRAGFYDSELHEVREMGIIADIDVWNVEKMSPACFIEVKAQKATEGAQPRFYLSIAEWRSYLRCQRKRIPYQVWLIQYSDMDHLRTQKAPIRLLVFNSLDREWLEPDSFLVRAVASRGIEYWIER